MKTFLNICISFVLFSFIFVSCDKDPVQNDPVIIVPVADSHYLSKEKVIYANTGDTSFVSFKYDQAKRVISIADSFKYGMPFEITGLTSYYYNGNDTLPYRSYHTNTGNFRDTTTQFYYYDSFGRKIKDSIIRIFDDNANHQVYHVVNHFEYATGKIYGYSVDSLIYTNVSPATYRHEKRDTATLDANNYVVSNIKHEWDGRIIHTEITNSTSMDPLSRLNIRSSLSVFPDGYGGYGNGHTSNNPTLIKNTISGTGSNVSVNSLVYSLNVSGYPSMITESNDAVHSYTALLFYTSL